MAVDDTARMCIINEWIEELTLSQHTLEQFDVSGTGLMPVRKEILAFLERAKQYAESKKPGYCPFTVVGNN